VELGEAQFASCRSLAGRAGIAGMDFNSYAGDVRNDILPGSIKNRTRQSRRQSYGMMNTPIRLIAGLAVATCFFFGQPAKGHEDRASRRCPLWVISGHIGLHEKASALPLKADIPRGG
jgi:hypothetical protein